MNTFLSIRWFVRFALSRPIRSLTFHLIFHIFRASQEEKIKRSKWHSPFIDDECTLHTHFRFFRCMQLRPSSANNIKRSATTGQRHYILHITDNVMLKVDLNSWNVSTSDPTIFLFTSFASCNGRFYISEIYSNILKMTHSHLKVPCPCAFLSVIL